MPTVQIKRGLAAALAAVNPTPLAGEIVWASDSNTLVVGNGSSAYSSLSVISATPTSHTHGNITNAGAIGSTANLPVITTTSGVLTTGTFGTSANTFCAGNDARLSDSRTPTGAAGGDLTGTYPNPTIAAGAIVTADLANDAVTYAKLQNVSATDRLLGRSSAGAGDVEEITCTSFGRSLISSADAPAARTTLSVQPTASPSFTGTTTVENLTLSGAARRIVADFSTTTLADRAMFQTSASNSFTVVTVVPSGTGTVSQVRCASNSTITNANAVSIRCDGTEASLRAEFLGTASASNLAIYTNNAKQVDISPTGTATFAGQVLVTAGSGSAGSYKPGLAVSGDDDTGVMQTTSGGANTLSLVTNGTERVRVGSGGRVQFFAAGEKYGVQINKDATGNGPFIGSDGADIFTISTAGGAERLRVDASGNVGIGASPSYRLHVVGSANQAAFIRTTATGSFGLLQIVNSNTNGECSIGYRDDSDSDATSWVVGKSVGGYADTFGWYYNASLMRLTTGGELIVGTTDQGAYNLQCNGTGVWGAGAYVNGSDERIKDDIAPLSSCTDVIESLRPVTFRYKESWSKDQSIQPGFIAQDLQQALAGQPYLDGVVQQGTEYLSVAYQTLIPLLVKALQESNARIAALEERLNG